MTDLILFEKLSKTLNESDKHNFTCQKCKILLYTAYEFGCCGGLVCQKCLSNECNLEDCNEKKMAHVATRTQKQIHSLKFNCIYPPCVFVGNLSELKNHYKELQCGNQPAKCQHCHLDIALSLMERHLQLCEKLPITCQCGFETTLQEKKKHEEDDCELMQILCPYRKWSGCKHESNRKLMKSTHMKDITGHMAQATKWVDDLKKMIKNKEQKEIELKSLLEEAQRKYQEVKKIMKTSHSAENSKNSSNPNKK